MKVKSYSGYVNDYIDNLRDISLSSFIENHEHTAIISVDMINGFCRNGNLASQRVAALIPTIVKLFEKCWDIGVRDFVLLQDCHSPDAMEFDAFAQHCICGSLEAAAVDEIKSLPFYPKMHIFAKNSLHPALGTEFDHWLVEHENLDSFIVVGNCTDLCVYQTVMYLRMTANAFGLQRRVITAENLVNTYDLSVEKAKELKIQPHPGDLMHKLFLHHMALNAIEIYKCLV